MEPTVSEPFTMAAVLATAVYVVTKFLEWLPRLKALLSGQDASEYKRRIDDRTAGGASVEYWQMEHRKAVAEVIGPMMQELVEVGKENTQALRQLADEIRTDRAEERGRRDGQNNGNRRRRS